MPAMSFYGVFGYFFLIDAGMCLTASPMISNCRMTALYGFPIMHKLRVVHVFDKLLNILTCCNNVFQKKSIVSFHSSIKSS